MDSRGFSRIPRYSLEIVAEYPPNDHRVIWSTIYPTIVRELNSVRPKAKRDWSPGPPLVEDARPLRYPVPAQKLTGREAQSALTVFQKSVVGERAQIGSPAPSPFRGRNLL